MKKLILIILLVLPVFAQSQGIKRGQVGTSGITPTKSIGTGGIDPSDGIPALTTVDSLILSMTVDATRETLIRTVYQMFLDSLGISTLRERLGYWHFYAANDSLASKLDWTMNGHIATTYNLLTFQTDMGWTRSAAGSYINSNFNVSTSPVFLQNSASLFFYSRTNIDETSINIGILKSTPVYESRMSIRLGGNLYSTLNTGTSATTIANSVSLGLFANSRMDSDSVRSYINGAKVGTKAYTSVAPINANIFILAANDGAGTPLYGATTQVACSGAGGMFTATEMRMIKNIVEYYMDAIGAGVIP